jgi:hypothetical protein
MLPLSLNAFQETFIDQPEYKTWTVLLRKIIDDRIGLEVNHVRQMAQLLEEDLRLRQLVAEPTLGKIDPPRSSHPSKPEIPDSDLWASISNGRRGSDRLAREVPQKSLTMKNPSYEGLPASS